MNLLIYGISGHIGKLIEDLAKEDFFWNIVEGVNSKEFEDSISNKYDVVIDFSHPSALDNILKICEEENTPLVIGTTGYSEEQLEQIKLASNKIPILKSTNMSLGMNLLFTLVEQTASILKDKVDIEVIEAHHNHKKDAPSGSAKSIVKSIEKGLGEVRDHKHGRVGESPRQKGEIGIHAIRGGNIVGEHEVNFISDLETIKICHEAYDRAVFAQGALEAAKFILNKEPRLYRMKDMLNL